jgi:hypothetical protein
MENTVELSILVVALAALILLAVTSLRFGVDSREGFESKERDLAARGLVWTTSAARDRFLANEVRQARLRRAVAGS